MKPSTYFVNDGFNFTKFAQDQVHWAGVLTSNCSLLWRTPYYSRKLCDGSYARADINKKIRELYKESLSTDGEDFVTAVSDFVSDMYDYQRISKRIASG